MLDVSSDQRLLASSTSPAQLVCRLIENVTELESLRPAWLALLARSASNEPMLSPDWLLTWWRVFGPQQDRRLRAVALYQEQRLVGLAPMLHRRHWHRGILPLRRLECLASGEREEDAICSDYLSVIAERGLETAVAAQFAAALATGLLGPWDDLVIPLMDGSNPMPALLVEACARHGLQAECTTTAAAPYIPLPATWDEYLGRMTSNHRRFLKRALREFETWAGPAIEVQRVCSPDVLPRGKEVLIGLHRQRWQGRVGGVFQSPLFLAFHEQVWPLLLDQGALEIAWLTVAGKPVAAVYNIVWHEKVSFYQCGRLPELPTRARAGLYLLAHCIRAHLEAGRREFDFLAGASQYKMQLALATRPIVEVRVARPSWPETLRRWLEHGAAGVRRLKQFLKRRPPTLNDTISSDPA